MTIVFFDTETTGFMTQQPLGHESQPRMVQLAFIVTDDVGNEMACYNSLVDTPVYIPEHTTAIHGKTKEMCQKYGALPITAISLFQGVTRRCDKIVGHNVYFDRQIIMNEMAHLDKAWKSFDDIPYECTMNIMQDVCKLPLTDKQVAAKMKGFKQPKLQEAYKYCFDKEFDGAHDALADVRACKDVYFWALNERMRNVNG